MRLIDADALLNRMQKDPLFDLVERYGVSGVINAEPTADAVPVRHGKWTRHTLGTSSYGTTVMHQCSECECMTISRFLYCPNCGARMDADKREEDLQRDYENSVEMAEYCEQYEPTYNPEDGSL